MPSYFKCIGLAPGGFEYLKRNKRDFGQTTILTISFFPIYEVLRLNLGPDIDYH